MEIPNNIKIVSFDVFDTLLTRRLGNPENVFLVLGKQLHKIGKAGITPELFARTRIRAEAQAYQWYGDGYNLMNIYEALKFMMGWSFEEVQFAMNAEIQLEKDQMAAIPQGVQKVRQAREQKKKIVFISDMYLPGHFIRMLLSQVGAWTDGDRLFLSCDSGCFKKNGLFKVALEAEGIEPYEMLHIGNHGVADIKSAQLHGIQTAPQNEGNSNRYETILTDAIWDTGGLSGVFAGASKTTRLNQFEKDPHKKSLNAISANVVGPVLTAFCLWLLLKVKENNLKRLYFVARDGQILSKITQRLVAKLNIDCEIRYICGSRRAWHVPAASYADADLSWLKDDTHFISVRTFFSRAGIAPESITGALEALKISPDQWDRNLTTQERYKLCENAAAPGEILDCIKKNSQKEKSLCLDYLVQEGLFDNTRWGIVDIGWKGRLLDSLSLLLESKSVQASAEFFFGLHEESIEKDNREAYLFSGRKKRFLGEKVRGIEQLMEVFCSADHGMTIGYVRKGEKIAPIYQIEKNENAIRWGLEETQAAVCEFVDQLYFPPFDNSSLFADMRFLTGELIKAFWLKPAYAEVHAWGNFMYEEGQGGDYMHPLAETYRWKDILPTFQKVWITPPHRASWAAGCWILTPKNIQTALNISKFLAIRWNSIKVRILQFYRFIFARTEMKLSSKKLEVQNEY